MPESQIGSDDIRYVAARRVLLDALDALKPQLRSVIVAGAQAIYLRTGDADLAISPFTTDSDLALNPSQLRDAPTLDEVMQSAGFRLLNKDGHPEPGIWIGTATIGGTAISVPVDLIVPEGAAAGGGRRGARLGIHGNRAARRAVGLEAALFDHNMMTIASLEDTDKRRADANVAGPAALLIAKLHKIGERAARGDVDRLVDKDAADVVRIMQTSDPRVIGRTMKRLEGYDVAREPTVMALSYLQNLFVRRGQPGIEMAVRGLRIALPADRVRALCVAFGTQLIEEIGQ